MARKNETLAQTVRGEFCRNLGWQRGAHGNLAQPRFYLGYDEETAPPQDLDANALDVWFESWAARPKKPSGGLYAKHTIRDIVKALRNFLKWLHRSKDWDWRLPDGYEMPRVRIKILPGERAAKPQLPKFKREELGILYNSALPLERLFILLGLNCGFGKADVETLQISEISFGDKSYIRRERTKTGVYGCWHLWPETVAGLHWYLDHVRSENDAGYVFISSEGRPYYAPGPAATKMQFP